MADLASTWIDTSDVARMGRHISRLPAEMRVKAASRAMSRVRSMATTRVVRRSAERIDIPQKHVRGKTRSFAAFNAGGATQVILVRSGWIPLEELGARQGKRGVSIRGRGQIRGAFRASMGSGHRGVFKRVGSARLPIRELFGPNPANDILTSPDEFLDVLEDVMRDVFAPRFLHEVDRLLARAGH
ncbi:phage tail protein [Afifella sp. IM 167]|uniref:phage tail protein n=1 Tax=Afifella sp. IM 167 TaxID=2033586 RepID=UPI001CC9CB8B|nr:phage tail protein [Afifella sp. IM 167]MBZ8133241.1 hypothetical protein [Afifella sp. IM 167]